MTDQSLMWQEQHAEFDHLMKHPEAVIEGTYQPDSYWYTDPDSGERTWIDMRGMVGLTFETHLIDEADPAIVTLTVTVDREAWENEQMCTIIRRSSIRELAARVVQERDRRARTRAILERGRIESGGTPIRPPGISSDSLGHGLFQQQESKWDR